VWLLLALCVRKMELLSARWEAFDLDAGVWTLTRENTKTRAVDFHAKLTRDFHRILTHPLG
jgi:integrase